MNKKKNKGGLRIKPVIGRPQIHGTWALGNRYKSRNFKEPTLKSMSGRKLSTSKNSDYQYDTQYELSEKLKTQKDLYTEKINMLTFPTSTSEMMDLTKKNEEKEEEE